jgi:hypothetical protein
MRVERFEIQNWLVLHDSPGWMVKGRTQKQYNFL